MGMAWVLSWLLKYPGDRSSLCGWLDVGVSGQKLTGPIIMLSISVISPEEASEENPAVNAVQREKKLLNGMIQNLLPIVGPHVRSIVLAYSFALSSKMVCG